LVVVTELYLLAKCLLIYQFLSPKSIYYIIIIFLLSFDAQLGPGAGLGAGLVLGPGAGSGSGSGSGSGLGSGSGSGLDKN
jgi:hypothetical protein